MPAMMKTMQQPISLIKSQSTRPDSGSPIEITSPTTKSFYRVGVQQNEQESAKDDVKESSENNEDSWESKVINGRSSRQEERLKRSRENRALSRPAGSSDTYPEYHDQEQGYDRKMLDGSMNSEESEPGSSAQMSSPQSLVRLSDSDFMDSSEAQLNFSVGSTTKENSPSRTRSKATRSSSTQPRSRKDVSDRPGTNEEKSHTPAQETKKKLPYVGDMLAVRIKALDYFISHSYPEEMLMARQELHPRRVQKNPKMYNRWKSAQDTMTLQELLALISSTGDRRTLRAMTRAKSQLLEDDKSESSNTGGLSQRLSPEGQCSDIQIQDHCSPDQLQRTKNRKLQSSNGRDFLRDYPSEDLAEETSGKSGVLLNESSQEALLVIPSSTAHRNKLALQSHSESCLYSSTCNPTDTKELWKTAFVLVSKRRRLKKRMAYLETYAPKMMAQIRREGRSPDVGVPKLTSGSKSLCATNKTSPSNDRENLSSRNPVVFPAIPPRPATGQAKTKERLNDLFDELCEKNSRHLGDAVHLPTYQRNKERFLPPIQRVRSAMSASAFDSYRNKSGEVTPESHNNLAQNLFDEQNSQEQLSSDVQNAQVQLSQCEQNSQAQMSANELNCRGQLSSDVQNSQAQLSSDEQNTKAQLSTNEMNSLGQLSSNEPLSLQQRKTQTLLLSNRKKARIQASNHRKTQAQLSQRSTPASSALSRMPINSESSRQLRTRLQDIKHVYASYPTKKLKNNTRSRIEAILAKSNQHHKSVRPHYLPRCLHRLPDPKVLTGSGEEEGRRIVRLKTGK